MASKLAAHAVLLAMVGLAASQVSFPGRPGRRTFPPGTPNRPAFPPGGPPPRGGGGGGGAGNSVGCTDNAGRAGQCVAAVGCPQFFEQILTRSGNTGSAPTCNLPDGSSGICCPGSATAARPEGAGIVLKSTISDQVQVRSFSGSELGGATTNGVSFIDNMVKTEKALKDSGNYIATGTPAAAHQSFFRTSPEAQRLGRLGMAAVEATRTLAKQGGIEGADAGVGLRTLTMRDTRVCPARTICNRGAQLFRTIDGSCNNPSEPDWGKSNTGMQRILPPTYNDGIFEPRTFSVTGRPLPSARLVSSTTISDADKPDRQLTAMVTQFGQFLDHDFTHQALFRLDAENNVGIQCCRNGQPIVPPPHFACLPIEIPANDPFYSRFNQRCMEFVRALPAPKPDCSLGFADQINVNTHFIDGSMIYGSNAEENRPLRAFRNGALAVTNVRSRHPFPPLAQREGDECTNLTTGVRCFIAGDDRINEQPGLTLIHLVWLREHNRVAAELQTLNPNWNDERLYQEAKKIVTAEFQHITYNEWLPLILGTRYMFNFGLLPQRFGYSQDYDPSINPSVTNEFAAACFRFGHTLLQAQYPLFNNRRSRSPDQVLLLRNLFNSIGLFSSSASASEALARGLSLQPMQAFDGCVTEEVTNQLFRSDQPFGLDLIALNTQRGRDHGIGTYNDVRELCGLGRARTFFDLASTTPEDSIRRFQAVYAHPDDIDLFVGGVSEFPADDGVLGPTFRCIIGDQFTRSKRGDRFFYEFPGPQGFTPDQLDQIRQTSMARILCDNTDVGEMQPLAFIRPSAFVNNKQACNSPAIPRVNFFPWQGGSF